jgi:hypothetical protein
MTFFYFHYFFWNDVVSQTLPKLLSVVMANVAWSTKRLLCEDDTIQSFYWPYTTGELINELSMVDEIMDLQVKLQQPTEMRDYFSVDMCFEEAFIDSHELLLVLLDRVTASWNANIPSDMTVSNEKHATTYTSVMSYKHAIKIFKLCRAALLRMRCIYEQLKPETQTLTKLCSSKTQLHNSMLTQRTCLMPENDRPVCSTEAESRNILHHLQERVRHIDQKMTRLHLEKCMLLNRIADEQTIRDAMKVCDILSSILEDGMRISDPTVALAYATDTIAPQRSVLERYSSCFDNTLQAFPDVYPSTCTNAEALDFLVDMSEALTKDRDNLMLLRLKTLNL